MTAGVVGDGDYASVAWHSGRAIRLPTVNMPVFDATLTRKNHRLGDSSRLVANPTGEQCVRPLS